MSDPTAGEVNAPGVVAPRLTGRSSASVEADKYHQMLALAELFEATGEHLRERSRLGAAVLGDEDVAASAALSPASFAEAEEDIRAATTGRHGLVGRAVELDADAMVVRATVLTYRWIDELQDAAYQALGSIAARAIGYLAPEVDLGGTIVSAGLIETDALDRDGVAAYLSDLAANTPELLDHISGGGGLLDGLQMRSLLTFAGAGGDRAVRGGLRAMGVQDFGLDAASALRDSIGAFVAEADEVAEAEAAASATEAGAGPAGLADLMAVLADARADTGGVVAVHPATPGRFIAYVSGPAPASATGAAHPGPIRLVSGDQSIHARRVVKAIERAVGQTPEAKVMLVGTGQGGATAAQIAAQTAPSWSGRFTVDQVVTAASPGAQVPVIPHSCRVLSLEDRNDPVALLGSLVNQGVANRVTVVYDAQAGPGDLVAGGRAADESEHPALLAEISRLRELGYLRS